MNKKIYIEAGANDGIFGSRSLKFYKNEEYQGILIEPEPTMFNICKSNRPLDWCYQAALVSFDYQMKEVPFFIHKEHSAMNGTKKFINETYKSQISVPARTLQSILDEKEIINVEYLFLDTEGFEIEVLKGIDFEKTIFKNIEIECHMADIQISPEEESEKFYEILKNKYVLTRIDKIKHDGNPKAIFNLK